MENLSVRQKIRWGVKEAPGEDLPPLPITTLAGETKVCRLLEKLSGQATTILRTRGESRGTYLNSTGEKSRYTSIHIGNIMRGEPAGDSHAGEFPLGRIRRIHAGDNHLKLRVQKLSLQG